MAVTQREITKGNEVPAEFVENLEDLLIRLNKFAEAIDDYYGYHIPLVVNSGIRTKEYQIEIYRRKANRREYPFANGIFDLEKVPMGSSHISCRAVDFRELPNNEIRNFIKATNILEELDLYCEDFRYTPTWTHIQTKPASKRIFIP